MVSGWAQGEALQEERSDQKRRIRNSAWDKGDEVRPWEYVWGYDSGAPNVNQPRNRRGLLRRQGA
jgi:hypothetical protein